MTEDSTSGKDAGSSPGRRMRPCPICSKLSSPEDYPFCSERCNQVDLHRWFSEGYSIPAVETDDVEDEDPSAG
ncbi:DNA gyrase inhibitor YacG [Roseibium sediminis]|uniref:DNA gyrase inhibitor YacG n=1 Tax=Roseibium sediminis TaxID=1775174 RepID=UPI00123D2249|nr:DNA gyrase inhibitor YacG [Roseibium sediminis]